MFGFPLARVGFDACLGSMLEMFQHGEQAVIPFGGKLPNIKPVDKIQPEIFNFLRVATIHDADQHGADTFDHQGVAVSGQLQAAVGAIQVEPQFGLAARHQVGVGLQGGVHRRHALAQYEEVLVFGVHIGQGVKFSQDGFFSGG